jgi:hypothetical protein
MNRNEAQLKSGILGRMQCGLEGVVQPGEQVITKLYALSRPSPHWHWLFHFLIVQALRTAFVVCLTNRRLLIFKSSKTLWGAGKLREQILECDIGSFKLTDEDKGKSAFLGRWRMVRLDEPTMPAVRLIVLENLWGGEAGVLMHGHVST